MGVRDLAAVLKKGFVLAAGFGERARPLSLIRPKPLFPVLGRPLIAHTLDRLAAAGVEEAVVNAHHLADRLVDFLTGSSLSPVIQVLREEVILGTGGGMRNAGPLLGSEPFFVVNGDVYTDADLAAAAADHLDHRPLATLVLHDCARFNQVAVDRDGFIVGFRGRLRRGVDGNDVRTLAFTGVHVVEPEVLGHIPEGPGDVIAVYQALIEAGRPIRAYVPDTVAWWDAGTLESYLSLHADLLAGREGGPLYMGDWVEMGPGVRIKGWASIGEAVVLESGAVVEDSVLWPGVRVAGGVTIRNSVAADGAVVLEDAVGRAVIGE